MTTLKQISGTLFIEGINYGINNEYYCIRSYKKLTDNEFRFFFVNGYRKIFPEKDFGGFVGDFATLTNGFILFLTNEEAKEAFIKGTDLYMLITSDEVSKEEFEAEFGKPEEA